MREVVQGYSIELVSVRGSVGWEQRIELHSRQEVHGRLESASALVLVLVMAMVLA
jgi:hypothetical protein